MLARVEGAFVPELCQVTVRCRCREFTAKLSAGNFTTGKNSGALEHFRDLCFARYKAVVHMSVVVQQYGIGGNNFPMTNANDVPLA